jgi:hypothetical protein
MPLSFVENIISPVSLVEACLLILVLEGSKAGG